MSSAMPHFFIDSQGASARYAGGRRASDLATAWRVPSIWRRIPAVSGGHAIADKAMPKNQWRPPSHGMPCAGSAPRDQKLQRV